MEEPARLADIPPHPSSTLFRREYVWRSPRHAFVAALFLALGIAITSVAAFLLINGDSHFPRLGVFCVLLIGILFGATGLIGATYWIGDKRYDIVISDEGITYKNRFQSWNEIKEFFGEPYHDGVCLGYTAKSGIQFGDGSLPTTPLLNEAEYILLATELQQRMELRFPHVRVWLYPISRTS